MKHLKKFTLNENKLIPISNINIEIIKNQIFSYLIETYEATDVFLDRSDISFEINNIATKKMNEFRDELSNVSQWIGIDELSSELEK